MVDNTTLNAGSGGDTIASDDIAGVKHQQVKVEWGVDGTATPVSAANPMPVVQTGTHAVNATLAAETTKVIGTVNVAAAQTLATVTTVGAVTAITNALPAGDNNIGNVDIASAIPAGTNNIGDVDVLSVIPGTGATNLGKVEDAAHTTGDVGVMSLAVRRDADTALVGTDGDYAPLQVNAAGSLKVAITAGAGSGGTSIADGAVFTRDTTSVTPVGAVVEASAPTLTAGDAAGLSMTTAGALRIAVASGGISGAVVDSVAGATDEGVLAVAVRDDALATLTPVDGDYTQLRTNARGAQWVALDSTDAQTVTVTGTVTVGSHAVTNAGTFATQVDGAALTALQLIDNPIVADDAAFTPGTTSVNMAGFQADETATDSVDEGDAGAARMTLDRKQIVTPYAHASAGGATPYQNLDVDESEDDIKASAGKLFWVHCINLAATKRYLKFYDLAAASVVVGTTTPVLTFPIPTLGDTNGAGFAINFGDMGVQFATAICVAATTGFAVADTGAPGANEVIINVGYL